MIITSKVRSVNILIKNVRGHEDCAVESKYLTTTI